VFGEEYGTINNVLLILPDILMDFFFGSCLERAAGGFWEL
jgi:hypothetical protein